LNLHNWRRDEWTPALRAAGLQHRGPYTLRHTYASWSIAAGVSLFDLSRLMGTSVEQLDKVYGHLLPDSLDRARTALDTYTMHSAGTEIPRTTIKHGSNRRSRRYAGGFVDEPRKKSLKSDV
jgi:hypothetical protein